MKRVASRGASARSPGDPRKRRTRQHVIADLSLNHVERFVFRRGHVAERTKYDYGIDLIVQFYDRATGHRQDGQVFVQLKATDRLRLVDGGRYVAVTVDRRDYDFWTATSSPVILVMYDAPADRAYWLYVQAVAGSFSGRPSAGQRRTITLRMPASNVLDEAAIDVLEAYNRAILAQLKGTVRHDAP